MSKRVTIMIDEHVDKIIREKQAREIMKTSATCSYSDMVGRVLVRGLRK